MPARPPSAVAMVASNRPESSAWRPRSIDPFARNSSQRPRQNPPSRPSPLDSARGCTVSGPTSPRTISAPLDPWAGGGGARSCIRLREDASTDQDPNRDARIRVAALLNEPADTILQGRAVSWHVADSRESEVDDPSESPVRHDVIKVSASLAPPPPASTSSPTSELSNRNLYFGWDENPCDTREVGCVHPAGVSP